MITIYSSHLSSRLRYAVDVVFQQILGLNVNLTNQTNDLKGVVINYSNEIIGVKSFQIKPEGLLTSSAIYNSVDKAIKHDRDLIRVFPNQDHFGFDIFSAVFFLVSRMEEYKSKDLDAHLRFKSTNSILFKLGVLDAPVIDIWSFNLLNSLNDFFNVKIVCSRKFNQFLTVDVDNAFAYKHKGGLRTIGASVKSLMKLDFTTFLERFKVLSNIQKDPYDNYDYLKQFIEKENINLAVFLLLGNYAKFDKNLSANNVYFISLIKQLSTFSTVGIHPSYDSYNDFNKMDLEITRLKTILSSKVNHSRNHFLRFKNPETFQHLLSLGIANDYSMGYADVPGFRAGTCSSFYFYDLSEDKKTDLLIIPFAYMDGAFRDYMNCSVEKAKSRITNLIRNVKSVEGSFVSVWHNESLSDQHRWKGWREVFEHTFKTDL